MPTFALPFLFLTTSLPRFSPAPLSRAALALVGGGPGLYLPCGFAPASCDAGASSAASAKAASADGRVRLLLISFLHSIRVGSYFSATAPPLISSASPRVRRTPDEARIEERAAGLRKRSPRRPKRVTNRRRPSSCCRR